MVLSLRNLVGTRFLLLIVGVIASFLTASFVSSPAYAATATWKDRYTITYNGVDYRGPYVQKLNIDMDGNQGDFNVFKPASGNSSMYLTTSKSLDTTRVMGWNSSVSAIGGSIVDIGLRPTSGGTPPGGTETGTGDTTESKETCNLTNIGWIVCPVSYFLGNITDAIYALVEKLLIYRVSENPLDTSDKNAVYVIWSSIRNLANVAFIFAFFAIIFSQATSIGLASYGIKKMLPRLIVAAILVNLSYFLCVFAVDVSNIIGAGIDGIIRYPLTSGLLTTSDPATAEGSWTGIIASLLVVGIGGAAIAAPGALAAALPFLVVALFAALTALVILIARQAILTILIIISPLAFVAYILPNTEDAFSKWRKLFTTLLVFYPMVAIVFAGSQVAAAIMRLTANEGTFSDAMIKVVSLAVQAFPLFALPFLLKISGGLLGRIGGMINNPNKGPFDGLRKRAEQKRDTVQSRARERALKRPRPDFTQGGAKNTRMRKAATFAANQNIFSGRRAAQSAVDRERALEEAKQDEAKAATGYFAGRVTSDANYANRMAGGRNLPGDLGRAADTQDLARLSGRATEALIKLNNEEIQAHNLSLNRNGAAASVGGIGINVNGQYTDVATGRVLTNTELQTMARAVDLDKALTMDSTTGRLHFDVETEAAIKYATANQLTTTSNGAKALGTTMAQTGILTADTAKALVDGVKGATPEDKSFITAHINSEAGKAGLKHLSYNTVDVNGNFQLGGQFGGVLGPATKIDPATGATVTISMDERLKGGVVGRLMQNGVSTLTKEMYKDPVFGSKLGMAVDRLEHESPETFESELVRMDPRKIENLVAAKVAAGIIPAAAADMAIRSYTQERAQAVEKYGLSG